MGAWIETQHIGRETEFVQVAPHVGAWIETGQTYSSTSRRITVAPHVGAWIETTTKPARYWTPSQVAPHVGAWIETPMEIKIKKLAESRAPRGRVD